MRRDQHPVKRGQVTIFIILGIVVLVLGGIGFYLWRISVEKEVVPEIADVPLEMQPIRLFVDKCIEEVAVPGVFLLANQGGVIYEYPKMMSAQFQYIAYHLEDNKDVGPDIKFMQQELARFIEDSLGLCVNKFGEITHLNLTFGEIKTNPVIAENEIILTIDYPITLTKESRKLSINKFRKVIPLRLGHILIVKDDVIKNIKSDPDVVELEYLTGFDVLIDILPVDKETLVYSITDEESNISKLIADITLLKSIIRDK